MHILLIHPYFLEDEEGGGSRWNEISRIWVKEGHQVTVLAGSVHYMQSKSRAKDRGYYRKETNRHGVTVIRCPVSDLYHRNFAGRVWAYFSFTFSALWAGLFVATEQYTLIIVTSPPLFSGITAMLLACWKKKPILLEIRDLWPESAIDLGILKNRFLIGLAYRFEKYLYKKAALICVLTPAFKNALITLKHIDEEKIIFIPNAADFHLSDKLLSDFDRKSFRMELGLDNRFIVIYVGAHGVANHLIQILDAAEILGNSEVVFMLVGDGMQKKELIYDANQRGLTNVVFVDPVSKEAVFKYILAADAGVSILKKADVFKTVYSNKTFDYFSCKKPVLIAIDGISRKLVEEANAGLYVEPENPFDFEEKIITYVRHPELARSHGENGYQYAKVHFDREVLAKKYLGLIIDLLK